MKLRLVFITISSIVLVLALGLAVLTFLPASTIVSLPLGESLMKGLMLLHETIGLQLFSFQYSLLIFAIAVILLALSFLLAQKKMRHWWWVAPLLVLIYCTLFFYSQLVLSQRMTDFTLRPAFLHTLVVSENFFLVHLLFALLLLLELVLATLLTYITIHRRKKYLARRPVLSSEASKVEQRVTELPEADPSSGAEEKLVFPPIPPLNRTVRKTISRKSTPSTDPIYQGGPLLSIVEPDPTLDVPSLVEEEKKLFIGTVKRQADSLVLTESPVEEERDEEIIPAQMPKVAVVEEVEKKRVIEEKPPVKEVPVVPAESTEEEDDIEVIAGVAGLVSSNEGTKAILRRSRRRYQFPPKDLLVEYPDHSTEIDERTRLAGINLIDTLAQFKVEAQLANIVKGPTVTMYEITPAPGVRVSAITGLADNIALRLAASQIRIVAPIPGKQAVGIEVPNRERTIIGFREMISTIDSKHFNIPTVLGKTITGEPVVIDLTQTPHLLIAGATGSGKSVSVNSLIASILFRKSPKDVRLILVDPKIVELQIYNDIPHLLTPVITEAKKTIKALEFCQYEMQRRYKLLNALAVRNLSAYNRKIEELHLAREKLPYIVVVIDEFADLMVSVGKELETLLGRLAAMSRAVGIHLVLATQRPSANVITGIIKANIPARIAFMVAGQVDSRIIIDENGAEKLLGKGDMLFVSSWSPYPIRIQGAFLSDEEVENLVGFVKQQGEPDYLDEAFFEDEEESANGGSDGYEVDDDSDAALMEKALKIVVERNGASASYLQRRLRIGYNRAARLVEQMEEDGYVGPARGSKPRELLRYPD